MVSTLQLFENYLPNAQNWAFRSLVNLPDTEVNVAAYKYYNHNQFVTEKINLVKMPDYVSENLLEGKWKNANIFRRIFKRINNVRHNKNYFNYLAQQCTEKKIDLIHCHFANMGWHYLELKKLTGLPFVVSFYGFDYESLPHMFPVWKKRYQELFTTADQFICEGEFGGTILEKQGCPKEKIEIVPLGVQTDKIPFKQRNKKQNELHLLQLANYAEKKGHIYALKAFIEAEKNCPDMTLTFVGRDLNIDHNQLVQLVKSNGLESKVKFLGFIDYSTLYDFMSNYHVFIHPSCYASNRDCEGGAPIVILDAECTGMPVISTTHCDIPGEVIHNVTGLLSPEKDVVSISKSIETFYAMNNNTYQQFAIAARKHVIDKFNIHVCANQLQKVYDKIKSAANVLVNVMAPALVLA